MPRSKKKSPKKNRSKNYSNSRSKSRSNSRSKSRSIKYSKPSALSSASTKFAAQLKSIGLSQSSYLKQAKSTAKRNGYNPSLLTFSDNSVHKLMYDGSRFGRVGYGDYIIWKHNEKRGAKPKGYAAMKRNVFRTSHSAIKGNWQSNPKSPNMLAIKILW
jgi:hypothetical protein